MNINNSIREPIIYDIGEKSFNTNITTIPLDKAYIFGVAPYNYGALPGATTTLREVVTLSQINTATFQSSTGTTVDISLNASDLSYVRISSANGTYVPIQTFPKLTILQYGSFNNNIIQGNLRVIGLSDKTNYSLNIYPYNKNSIEGAVNNLQLSTTPLIFVGQMTPPINFTSNSITINQETGDNNFKNGTYLVSSSSNHPDFPPFKAFNNTIPDFWHTSEYNNSASRKAPYNNVSPVSSFIGGISNSITYYWTTDINNISYAGEWLQIQYPYSFILTSYSITNRSDYNATWANRGLKLFYVAGSNDGIIWNMLNQQDIITIPSTSTITINVTTINKYSYYRLVVNKIFTGPVVNLCEWKLFGNYFTSNLLSIINDKSIKNATSYTIDISLNTSDLSYVTIQPNSDVVQTFNKATLIGSGGNYDVNNGILSGNAIVTGLTPGTTYTFTIVPYNYFELSNNSVLHTLTGTTAFGIISTSFISSELTTLDISLNSTDLSYVTISPSGLNYNSGEQKIFKTQIGTLTNNILNGSVRVIGLSVNTPYTFSIYPFDSNNTRGDLTTIYANISDINAVSYNSTDPSTNYIDISLNTSDLSYVKVTFGIAEQIFTKQSIIDNGSYTTGTYPLTGNVRVVNLAAGNRYDFNIYPYSFDNIRGSNKPLTTYTLSQINSVGLKAATGTSIDISLNTSDLSYVLITRSTAPDISFNRVNLLTSGNFNSISNILIGNVIIVDLSANQTYDFVVIPYNFTGLPGLSKPLNTTTLSVINGVTYISSTNTTVDISLNASDLSYVEIIPTGLSRQRFTKENIILRGGFSSILNELKGDITITGLTLGTSYALYMYPYNFLERIGAPTLKVVSTLSNTIPINVSTPIANNNFSNPTVSVNSYTRSTPTSWSSNTSTDIYIIRGIQYYYPVPSPSGISQYVSLTATAYFGSKYISQNITLSPNSYTLSFYCAPGGYENNNVKLYYNTCSLKVTIGAQTLVSTLKFSTSTSSSDNIFTLFSYNFSIVTTDLYNLNFTVSNTSNQSSSMSITGVNITSTSYITPPPLPLIIEKSIKSVTFNSIEITLLTSDLSYVTIQLNSTSVQTFNRATLVGSGNYDSNNGIITANVSVSSLSPGTNYTLTLVPYNSDDLSNTTLHTLNTTTLS